MTTTEAAWRRLERALDRVFGGDENPLRQLGGLGFFLFWLIAVSGGPSGPLESMLLRSRAKQRDVMAWKRGETTASAGEIMGFNGLTAEAMANRAKTLAG